MEQETTGGRALMLSEDTIRLARAVLRRELASAAGPEHRKSLEHALRELRPEVARVPVAMLEVLLGMADGFANLSDGASVGVSEEEKRALAGVRRIVRGEAI